MRLSHERRNGVDRRDNPGRREEDPAEIPESTWQEACGHDRKVIQLLQQGYKNFAQTTIVALVLMAILLGFSIWRGFILAADNEARIKDIQAERYDNALSSCEETNLRNKSTIAELDTLVGKSVSAVGVSKTQIAQIKANQVSTVLLIDDLAPYHTSCPQYARQAVRGGSTP